jgi:hypothetical protein
MKVGDTAPKASADLNADLTGATVRMHLSHNITGVLVLDKLATITNAALGLVEYQWVSGDLASLTAGAYRMDWLVTFADGRVEHFPQASNNELVVRAAV